MRISHLTTARHGARIDSGGALKAKSQKKGSSYVMTQSDKLIQPLMFEHGASFNDATELVNLFDETDWQNNVSMRRLRRRAVKLLGNETGGQVFGMLRSKGSELSLGA